MENEAAQRHNFHGQSILSVNQFNRADLAALFNKTDEMIAHPLRFQQHLAGSRMTTLFFEASTRTSTSFVAAMQNLGGHVIQNNGVEFSSVSKGEDLEDTVRTLSESANVLVLRHPEVGAAERAAQVVRTPIINAGDGIGEHPTQALLDAFTIQRKLRDIDGKTVTMVGDMKHGRTIHSLARLLTLFENVHVNFVSPPQLEISDPLKDELRQSGLQFDTYHSLNEVMPHSDVLYVTRVQKERFQKVTADGKVELDKTGNPIIDLALYDSLKDKFIITPDTLLPAKEKMIVMHPLPRVNEIDRAVDNDPRAVYFDQVRFGTFVRMALLTSVMRQDVLHTMRPVTHRERAHAL